MKYELQPLPYAYDALEPYIDAKTMETHHSKHHHAYINKLNEALSIHPEIADISVEELLKDTQKIPHDIRQAVINHGGGTYNHDLFWKSMSPSGMREPGGVLGVTVQQTFGSYDEFWKQFAAVAVGQFGSGWAWLTTSLDNPKSNIKNQTLKIISTGNQNSPLSTGELPLLGIDVWEHAYYLQYQNRRADYIEAWKSVIDWAEAARRYEQVLQ